MADRPVSYAPPTLMHKTNNLTARTRVTKDHRTTARRVRVTTHTRGDYDYLALLRRGRGHASRGGQT